MAGQSHVVTVERLDITVSLADGETNPKQPKRQKRTQSQSSINTHVVTSSCPEASTRPSSSISTDAATRPPSTGRGRGRPPRKGQARREVVPRGHGVYINLRKLTTRVDYSGGANPTWNDKFVFRVSEDFLYADTSAVVVEIYTLHWFRDVHVGTIRVLISNLIPPNRRPGYRSNDEYCHTPPLGMRFVALQVRPSPAICSSSGDIEHRCGHP
ncbi:hypothetical protein YC2023_049741 [Brassica napus]